MNKVHFQDEIKCACEIDDMLFTYKVIACKVGRMQEAEYYDSTDTCCRMCFDVWTFKPS